MMNRYENWDWSTESKEVPIGEWKDKYNWVEDFNVSPDGEKVASIVNIDDMEFGICENGSESEEVFEKAWSLKYTPDGKAVAFVANDEEWTVFHDGDIWEEKFDYIWDMKISRDGKYIGACIQRDGEYGMAVNNNPWNDLYDNISGAVLSDNGNSAAVVQIKSLNQGDIEGFSEGVFSVAVNGELKTGNHLNIWDISFNRSDDEIGYSIRKNRTGYSVGRNSDEWDVFQCSWQPVFTDDNALLAPVKNGKWFIYKDNKKMWEEGLLQITKIVTKNGNTAAVVSDKYGKWSVAENGKILDFRCDMMVSDLIYSDDGKTLVSVFKNKDTWDLNVNNKSWNLKADKLWSPCISCDNSVIAARMEKDGRYYLVVNGKIYNKAFDMVFDPYISPDNGKVLLKTIENGIYKREVLSLDQIL